MESQGAKAVRTGTENENAFFDMMKNFCGTHSINIINDLKVLKIKASHLSKNKATSITLSKEIIEAETKFEDGVYFLAIPTEKKHKDVIWNYDVVDEKTTKTFSQSVKFDACFFIIKNKKIVSLTFVELKNCNVEGSDTEKLSYKANFIIDEKIPAKFILFVSGELSKVGGTKYIEVIRIRKIERFLGFKFFVKHEFDENPEIIYDYIKD
jgi:hypothetical protein